MNQRRIMLMAAGAVVLICAVGVGMRLGFGVLVASMFAGALIGAWAHVYVRCLCASQPMAWSVSERAAAAGALAAPPLVLLASLLGPAVWVAVVIAALAWAAAVTGDGHLYIAGRWLRIPTTLRHR